MRQGALSVILKVFLCSRNKCGLVADVLVQDSSFLCAGGGTVKH